jgi:hypothetical protein
MDQRNHCHQNKTKNSWFLHECENVTNYYRNHPNNWKCANCKKCKDRLSSESSLSPSPLKPRRAKVRFTLKV